MNPHEYLTSFFAELERLADGIGARHAISTTKTGALDVRLGNGDWYPVSILELRRAPRIRARRLNQFCVESDATRVIEY